MLSERQLRMRTTGIGASEIAIVAGYDPYSTPMDLFNAKVFGATKPQTNAMRAGNFLEDGVAQMYLAELALDQDRQWKLRRARTRRHAKHRWMLATIDREVVASSEEGEFEHVRIAEIKLPGSRYAYNKHTGERDMVWGHTPDAIPPSIAMQAQAQMAVTGDQECDVVAFFLDTRELAIYRQVRNELLIESLIELNKRFWFDHIVAKQPPQIDGSHGASEYLKRRFPHNDGSLVPAPHGTDLIAREYARAQKAEKAALADKDLLGNQLRELVGRHDGVIGPWGKVTWKCDSRGDVDHKKVAQELRLRVELLAEAAGQPELASDIDALIERCRVEPSRPLRVTYKWALEEPPQPVELTLVPAQESDTAA